jgi:hypothetical protein
LPILEIERLPDIPDSIDLRMVSVECGITRRHKEISTRIAIDGVMSTTVDANTPRSWVALHIHFKVTDIVIVEDERQLSLA